MEDMGTSVMTYPAGALNPVISISGCDKIASALAKAQGQMTNPPKTKTANIGKYKYRYADLAEIIEHVRPVLSKHDLAVSQLIQTGDSTILVTRLLHASGQYLQCTYPLPKSAPAQDMGSALTYARRYSLCAILGIAADEDDDGAKAQDSEANAPKADADRDKLIELMSDSTIGNKALMDYCKANGLGEGRSTEDLPDASIKTLVDGWTKVAETIKQELKAKPLPKNTKAVQAADKPVEAGVDVAGMDSALAEKMSASGVTKQMLKAYYTGAKHLPATTEPENLPASYIKALLVDKNWEKAVKTMKKEQ
jgi:hypothetical protein